MATYAIPPEHPGTVHRVTSWDRAAILSLGAAACALSYDALQQMAVAIHVRGLLTYLLPLVIDGFIAYGVRALLVLRTAPFRARLYVWALFGTATCASIWANALHAVRINQQSPPGTLHLSDLTVGILSTLAPLALAGAVHLHILITRETTTDTAPPPVSLPGPEQPTSEPATTRRGGRPADATLDELVEIGRIAVAEHGRISRSTVLQAIRDKGLKIGGERLTEVMNTLRAESETNPADG
ncbi:DUF2637 domain-containing protein [Streptomyces uncialis]|uniref:DUF2637 domain-containing protein n=1 Tax=Streptomyces uncialis TaxID=1048205 RepID=UPI002E36C5D8|nr:DUF2637 domain-containing protein [Streptomyces uncialis]